MSDLSDLSDDWHLAVCVPCAPELPEYMAACVPGALPAEAGFPAADCFQKMLVGNVFTAGKVGNGTGDF